MFEGGGAKGIAHFGAYRAAFEAGLEIRHVAGTSAGAIIAALVAAGYRPDELLDVDRCSSILQRVGTDTPVALFGAADWHAFTAFRRHGTAVGRLLDRRWIGIAGWRPASVAGRCRILIRAGLWVARAALGAGWAIFMPVRFARRLCALWRHYGWFGTARIREVLNRLLWMRVHGADTAPDPCPDVCFEDLPNDLRIVATDLDTGQITMFDRHLWLRLPVADAVAASVAIPLAFRPKVIGDRRYQDGGMVSNLPAWLFDAERLDRPSVRTLAFRLDDAPAAPPRTFKRFMLAAARAAIFGGQSVGLRAIDSLVDVAVPADIGVLDFDLTWEQAKGLHDAAFESAQETLDEQLTRIPQRYVRLCSYVRDLIRPLCSRPCTIRVNLAFPEPDLLTILCRTLRHPDGLEWQPPGFLRIRYSVGMENDADDTLFLPVNRSVAGAAFRERAIALRPNPRHDHATSAMPDDKYRHALTWPELNTCLSIPVFADPEVWNRDAKDRPAPLCVLSIDSDTDLHHIYEQKRELLVLASKDAHRMMLEQLSGRPKD